MQKTRYTEMLTRHRTEILAAERHIWTTPESGYKEWKTHAYMKAIFENAGYTVVEAGDIPGFYADLDTGKPGPKVLILAELDALTAPDHPEAVDGCAHACGHHAQCAAMAGMALVLKEPGALEGLCGSIRLMLVPAEELIELPYRNELRRKGVIRYLGGKTEFLYRGYMDGVDIAFMFHTTPDTGYTFSFAGCNGCLAKEITFSGKAAHAGGSPDKGINALYAANMALSGINALRETFRDADHVRVHPILNVGDVAVNIIPPKADVSTFIRGASIEVLEETNHKINRALAAGALALGAGVHVLDQPGYAPLHNDPLLQALAERVLADYAGRDQVKELPWGTGCTDMGDISCVIRAIHPHVAGAGGTSHGTDYHIADPETACIVSAEGQLILLAALLENDAAEAKKILAGKPLRYSSKEEYFAAIEKFAADRDLVTYTEAGAAVAF